VSPSLASLHEWWSRTSLFMHHLAYCSELR
jgi:hypothetical protein